MSEMLLSAVAFGMGWAGRGAYVRWKYTRRLQRLFDADEPND